MSETKTASYQITDEDGDQLTITVNETGYAEVIISEQAYATTTWAITTLYELERALADIRSRLFPEARTFDPEAYRQPGGVHG